MTDQYLDTLWSRGALLPLLGWYADHPENANGAICGVFSGPGIPEYPSGDSGAADAPARSVEGVSDTDHGPDFTERRETGVLHQASA